MNAADIARSIDTLLNDELRGPMLQSVAPDFVVLVKMLTAQVAQEDASARGFYSEALARNSACSYTRAQDMRAKSNETEKTGAEHLNFSRKLWGKF